MRTFSRVPPTVCDTKNSPVRTTVTLFKHQTMLIAILIFKLTFFVSYSYLSHPQLICKTRLRLCQAGYSSYHVLSSTILDLRVGRFMDKSTPLSSVSRFLQ